METKFSSDSAGFFWRVLPEQLANAMEAARLVGIEVEFVDLLPSRNGFWAAHRPKLVELKVRRGFASLNRCQQRLIDHFHHPL